jgi:hypothetical protein
VFDWHDERFDGEDRGRGEAWRVLKRKSFFYPGAVQKCRGGDGRIAGSAAWRRS